MVSSVCLVKRLPASFAASLLFLAFLPGCGDSGNNSAASPSSEAASPSGGTAGSNASAGTGGETVELELFQFAGPVEGAYNKVIEAFEKHYPNIKIKQNIVADAFNVLDMRMAAGDYPDLFSIGHSTSFLNYVQNGWVEDLSGESFLKNVNPSALETTQVDGKQYSFPAVFNTYGIYYNKQIFSDLGIEIPKTKDELIEDAKKIQAAGITPFVFPDKDMPSTNQLDFQAYTGAFLDNPKQLFRDAMDKKLHLTDSKELREAAQMYVDLREYGKDNLSTTFDNAANLFATGKVAMMPYVSIATGVISAINPDLDFSIFPIPGNDPDKIHVPYGIGFQLCISAKSKHVEEAKLFLDFWSKPENAAIFETIEKAPSTIIGVQSTTQQTEYIRQYFDAGKIYEWPSNVPGWKTNQLNDSTTYAQYLSQSKDVDQFLKQLDNLFYGVK